MASHSSSAPNSGARPAASANASVTARPVGEGDHARWDAFCTDNRASYGSFFHWQSVLSRMGHKPLFLLAEGADGAMCGCLPLAVSRACLARRATSAWGDGQTYGGPLVTTTEAVIPLLELAEALLRREGVACLGLMPDPCQPLFGQVCAILEQRGYACVGVAKASGIADLRDEETCHTFRIALDEWDSVWGRFHRKVRNRMRSALSRGVTVKEVSIEDFCVPFHQIQVDVWRRLGNTCPNLERLRLVLECMGSRARTYLAWLDGQVVAGLYVFNAGRVCYMKGAASDDQYASYGINNLTYSRAIEDAVLAGLEVADMGWTPPPSASGHHQWKALYAGTPYPVLTYKRVLNPVSNFLDRSFLRLTDRLARRISYDPPWLRVLGPLSHPLLRWTRR